VTTLLVAIGGLAALLARFGIGRLSEHHSWLIWSTVGINIAGSF
jgi:fluoride ion exporter CrcB/FEX